MMALIKQVTTITSSLQSSFQLLNDYISDISVTSILFPPTISFQLHFHKAGKIFKERNMNQ
jgi:hypothetical protein